MIQANRLYSFDYLCGWRYLFSADYRQRIHARWGGNSMTRLMCMAGGVLGIMLTSSLAILAVLAILNL